MTAVLLPATLYGLGAAFLVAILDRMIGGALDPVSVFGIVAASWALGRVSAEEYPEEHQAVVHVQTDAGTAPSEHEIREERPHDHGEKVAG